MSGAYQYVYHVSHVGADLTKTYHTFALRDARVDSLEAYESLAEDLKEQTGEEVHCITQLTFCTK